MCSTGSVTLVGGLVKAGSLFASGRQEQASSKSAEQQARTQSQASLQRGQWEAMRARREGERLMGRQVAAAAASGADPGSGSALAIQVGTARRAESDAQQLQANAFMEAQGYHLEALSYRKRARAAAYAGFATGAGELLGATGTAYESKSATGKNVLGPKGPF